MDQLCIVTTGGTIDKIYFDDKSDYQIGEPQIGGILRELGVAFQFNVIPIMRKDSLHITAEDRELIRATIAAQPARHVLVTHGTDTMVETAKVLASLADKTIVLTGALSPARFRGSDAEFNVGSAVGAVQSLPPGVYIAMNGRIWDPTKVRKNVAANRFEPRRLTAVPAPRLKRVYDEPATMTACASWSTACGRAASASRTPASTFG